MFIMTQIKVEVVDEKNLHPLALHHNTHHNDNHELQTTTATVHLNQTNHKTKGELNRKDTRLNGAWRKKKQQT